MEPSEETAHQMSTSEELTPHSHSTMLTLALLNVDVSMTILADKFADAATLDLKISQEFLIDNAELPTSFLLHANAQFSVSIRPLLIAHAMLEIKDSHTTSQL